MIVPLEQVLRNFGRAQQKRKRQTEITRRFRALGLSGRLYWHENNPFWHRWGSDDIAMWKCGTIRTYFQTMEAIENFVQYHAEEETA